MRETNPNFKDKVWQYISMLFFFLGLLFLIIEMKSLENTFEETKIWRIYGLSGIGLAAIFLIILNKIQPTIFHDNGRRYSVIFGFVLGLSSLSISSVSYLNREFSKSPQKKEEYTIIKKSISGKRNIKHWIFINYNNSEIRLEVSKEKWNELHIDKIVELKTKNGYLNYKFLTRI